MIVGEETPVVEVEVEYADGTHDFLDATPGHPFAVAGLAWVEAADLEPGDRLYTPWGLDASVVGVAPGRGESVVYNLSVAQAHTFFVAGEGGDGVWVHNCPRGLRGPWRITEGGTERVVNHARFGKFYKSKSDGSWWARDRTGHGGSRWKVFREGRRGLEWRADADEFGDFIPEKHKGPVGVEIPWSELAGATN